MRIACLLAAWFFALVGGLAALLFGYSANAADWVNAMQFAPGAVLAAPAWLLFASLARIIRLLERQVIRDVQGSRL